MKREASMEASGEAGRDASGGGGAVGGGQSGGWETAKSFKWFLACTCIIFSISSPAPMHWSFLELREDHEDCDYDDHTVHIPCAHPQK